MRAERLQLAHRRLHGCRDFGIDPRVAERRREGDAQAADAVVEADRVVARIERQRSPVARVGALQHVHHQRRVGDAHRVRAEVGDGAHRRERIGRHAAEARLQTEVAAERCRDAHAAGAVGADRERPHAGGDRGRGAARGAARRLRRIPGLRVMPVSGELVSPLQPNSGVVVLPRITAPASRRRAVAGASTSHGPSAVDGARAAPGRPALGEDQVLDRHGHAVELAAGRALIASAPRSRAPPPRPLLRRRWQNALRTGLRRSMRSSTLASPRPARRRRCGRGRAAFARCSRRDRSREHASPRVFGQRHHRRCPGARRTAGRLVASPAAQDRCLRVGDTRGLCHSPERADDLSSMPSPFSLARHRPLASPPAVACRVAARRGRLRGGAGGGRGGSGARAGRQPARLDQPRQSSPGAPSDAGESAAPRGSRSISPACLPPSSAFPSSC